MLVLSLEKRGENRYPGTMINTSRVLRGCYEGIFVRLGGKKKNVATWSTACIHPHPPPRALHNRRGRRAWSNVYGKLVLPRNIGCTLEECRVTVPKSCPLERLILLFLIVSHRLNRELNDWNDFFNETHWYPCTSSLREIDSIFHGEKEFKTGRIVERERGQPAVKVYTRWDRCWRDRAERQPVVAHLHARDRKPRARKRRGAEDRRTRYTRYLIRHSKHDIFSRAGIHTGRKSRRGLDVCRFTPARHYLRPVQARPN